MSISLYRKYRPQNFAGVYGQNGAISIISQSIIKKRVGHAYLFSGGRGCGKTSVARIFAKALNCLERKEFEPCGQCANCTAITAGESLDVIEIDGASNNGVDSIRELKENVTLAPFTSKYKIYIIDEVHMLSQGAFNALLKTLEEPPEHIIFILATTEPHKVPVTIRSRCQHIPFHTISPEDIYKRLNEVCTLENVKAEPEALWEIARQAEGAMRDALSLLEQVMAFGDVTLTLSNVEAACGTGSRSSFEKWIKTLRTEPGAAYENLNGMFDAGGSGVRVFEEMFSLIRDLWLVSKWPKVLDSLGISELEKNFLKDEAKNWKPEKLHYLLNVTNKILTSARMGIKSDILLGMFLMMLEPAPAIEAGSFNVNVVSAPPPPPAAPVVEAPKPVTQANEIEYDEALKENLLTTAREKNFMIYCGLYDAKAYAAENKLYLEMEDLYCYEVLRTDRNSSALRKIFDNYSQIILKFGKSEIEIFNQVKVRSEEAGSVDEVGSRSDEAGSEVNQVEIRKQEAGSVFDKFRNELVQLQTRPEVILIKHEENINEDLTADTEQEQEGDNE